MPIKQVLPKITTYANIQRGTSLTIPCLFTDAHSNPVDLTNFTVYFTIKPVIGDSDWDDNMCMVQKTFAPQDPINGKFYVQCSSHDLYFEPGHYYFDVELRRNDGAVARLTTMDFTLVAGPTNRSVNEDVGQIIVGDEIRTIWLDQGDPVVVISQFVECNDINVAALYTLAHTNFQAIADLTQNMNDQIQGVIQEFSSQIQATNQVVAGHAEAINTLNTELQHTNETLNALAEAVSNLNEQLVATNESLQNVNQTLFSGDSQYNINGLLNQIQFNKRALDSLYTLDRSKFHTLNVPNNARIWTTWATEHPDIASGINWNG